jgi:hypothetical protein
VDTSVEVRYAGVSIGRSTFVRDWSDAGAFVGLREPMPVGTPLRLKGENADHAVRVTEVVESADANVAGMRVVFVAVEAPTATASGERGVDADFATVADVDRPGFVTAAADEAAPSAEPTAAEDTSEVHENGQGDAGADTPTSGAPTDPSGAASGATSGSTAQEPRGGGSGAGKRRRRRR